MDRAKKRNGQPSCWFLRYTTPKLNEDGTAARTEDGAPVLQRHRPYYPSKAKAEADKPNIAAQHSTTGAGSFLFDRTAAADYEAAVKIVGKMPLVEVAKFWRLHHPLKEKQRLRELADEFIADTEKRLGDPDDAHDTRHISDLRSRVGAFVVGSFGERYPDTVTRNDVLIRNRSACQWAAWRTCSASAIPHESCLAFHMDSSVEHRTPCRRSRQGRHWNERIRDGYDRSSSWARIER